MQRDEKKYKNELDDFSESIKQKVDGHRMPVDDDVWNGIAQYMEPAKNKRFMWWAVSSAAVAVLLVALLLLPLKEQDDFKGITTSVESVGFSAPVVSKENNLINEPDAEKKENSEIKIKKSSGSVRLISQQVSKAVSNNDGSSGTTKPVENSLLMNDTVQLADIGNSLVIADTENKSDLPVTEVTDSVSSHGHKEVKKSNEPAKILIEKSKKQDKWLLAASFSSGGGTSFGRGDVGSNYYDAVSSLPDGINNFSVAPEADKNNFLGYDEFSHVNHSIPLSFGVTVRKDLSERFAVETGLMYTYLSSKFSKQGTISHSAKQELHYLGIPLNAVVYIWNSPNWSLYVSGGGIVEKGLKMNYTQNITSQNNANPSKFSSKESIDGYQWSVNASVGITYKFYRSWGLYFEPRYSYYFDNNQPFSIRTENSQVFGLTAGLRYQF